jgi:hypothetical protein
LSVIDAYRPRSRASIRKVEHPLLRDRIADLHGLDRRGLVERRRRERRAVDPVGADAPPTITMRSPGVTVFSSPGVPRSSREAVRRCRRTRAACRGKRAIEDLPAAP